MFSTAAAMATLPSWAGRFRARSLGRIRCLYLDMAVSIVRMQSTKRFALAVGTGRDDVADFDGAVGDDYAAHRQFEQHPLLVEVDSCQSVAHTAAERLGVGCQASRLALALGIVREFGPLPNQCLQPCPSVALAALVFDHRHDASEVGVRKLLDLRAESRSAAARVGPAYLQFMWQPMAAARPHHRMRIHIGRGKHLAQVAPDEVSRARAGM